MPFESPLGCYVSNGTSVHLLILKNVYIIFPTYPCKFHISTVVCDGVMTL